MGDINKIGITVSIFLILLIGIVLLQETADNVFVASEGVYSVVNESITLTNAPPVELDNNWVTSITSLALPNGTTVSTSNYTTSNLSTTNIAEITYTVEDDATDFNGNTSYVTYAYQDDNYVRSSMSRVMIGLITLFFALGIIGLAIAGMYKMGVFELFRK